MGVWKALAERDGREPSAGCRGRGRRATRTVWLAAACVLCGALLLGAGEKRARNTAKEVDVRVVDAAREGDLDALHSLIGQGASVNATNAQGATALMAAAFFGRTEAARALLGMGADVNHRSLKGHCALMMAVEREHPDIVRLLLDAGAPVNGTDNEVGGTALMRAAELGSYETVKLLIEKGADVNAQTQEEKSTALSLASGGWNLTVARLLLDSGAKGSKLVVMAQAGDLKAVRQLLQDGADVNETGPNGETALSMAALGGNAELVRLLLEAGADPKITSPDRFEEKPVARAPTARVESALGLLEQARSATLSPAQEDNPAVERFLERGVKDEDLKEVLRLLQTASASSPAR